MPTRDGIRNVVDTNLLVPQEALAIDTDTAPLDGRDGDSSSFVIMTGAVVDAGLAAVVEVSDDDGDADPYAAAPADDVIGDAVAAADLVLNSSFKVGYVGPKRFSRLALTIPGASDIAVLGLVGYLHQAPEADKE